MAASRFVFSKADFDKAAREGRMLRIVADCPNSQFNGYTVLECLNIGVSNPYSGEYPTISDSTTDIMDVSVRTSLESLNEKIAYDDAQASSWDANGSPVGNPELDPIEDEIEELGGTDS